MSKSLLIIQFRENKDIILSEQKSFKRCLEKYGYKANFLDFFSVNSEWNNFSDIIGKNSGVVLGGSGEYGFDGGKEKNDPKREMSHRILEKISPFLKYAFSNDIPLFGICYGHQIMAAFCGVNVVNDKGQSKVGSYEVIIDENYRQDPLLKDLPVDFIVQYGHKDSLENIPNGAQVIARSPICNYAALKYSPNIYSVQFHPELTLKDIYERLNKSPGYLPENEEDLVVKPSPYADLILRNFAYLSNKNKL